MTNEEAKDVGFDWSDDRPTPESIAGLQAGKDYRPTIMAVIRDAQDHVLLLQSEKNPDEWMLLQGGIDPGEDPSDAVDRELHEEIGLTAPRVRLVGYRGSVAMDYEAGRIDTRGYAKGKRYFIYELACVGRPELILQRDEVRAGVWLRPSEIAGRLAAGRPEKRDLILAVLRRTGLLP